LTVGNFSRVRILLFYHSIAKTNWLDYIKGKELINRKKYIYILKHILAAEYLRIHESCKGLPPSNFEELLKEIEIPENCQKEIEILIQRKKAINGQWEKEKRIPELDEWITKLRDINSEYGKEHRNDDAPDVIELQILDSIFRNSLK
jgi:predicted nucleotidyltransferase